MAETYNNVVILGRAATDPRLTFDPQTGPRTEFEVLTKRRGGMADETALIRVEARRRLAELLAKFVKKDRQVLIVGELGQGFDSALVVHASEVKFLKKEDEE